MINKKSTKVWIFAAASLFVGATLFILTGPVSAHKKTHSSSDIQAFDDAYMEVVKMGDALFHGGGPQKDLGVTMSKTGMACAMCHPFASDVHPHQFPKFQEQMSEVAGLREMINWCIEKPNEGVKIGIDSEAMIALEAYIMWSHKGTIIDPGTH
jgi:thiosulfate dehydrogenase